MTISTITPGAHSHHARSGHSATKHHAMGDGFSRSEKVDDPTLEFKKWKASHESKDSSDDGKIHRKHYRVKPGTEVDLSRLDPNDATGMPADEAEAKEQLKHLLKKISKLQGRLYAEHKHKLLIVLQGMDTAGKDGTIKSVFRGVNPQGVHVASFKVPTAKEADHDFLWRVHEQAPGKGEIGIFNRSHYEDVLVTRVHGMVDDDQAAQRFEHINNFEKLLTDEGTTVVKIFLNIDKDEQKKRLQARLDDPEKNWKFSTGDLKERKLWDKYQTAYSDVLTNTSTENAPWYVVPANNKLHRDLIVAHILLKTLEKMDIQKPQAEEGLKGIVIE